MNFLTLLVDRQNEILLAPGSIWSSCLFVGLALVTIPWHTGHSPSDRSARDEPGEYLPNHSQPRLLALMIPLGLDWAKWR